MMQQFIDDQIISLTSLVCDNDLMISRANKLLLAEKYQQAIDLYKQYLSGNPDQRCTLAALYNLGEAYDKNKQFEQSADCYRRIIAIDPNFKNGQAYYELGQVLQQSKKYQECKNAYLCYLKRFPDHSECNFNLGVVFYLLKDFQSAHSCYEKAYTADPTYIRAYKERIDLYMRQNKYEDVLKVCQIALKYQPTDFQLLYFQGISYLRLNRYKEAETPFKESIQHNKKYVRSYIALAEAKYKIEDNSGIHLLQTCLKDNKNVMKQSELKEINYLSGIFKMRLGLHREAAQCFKAVLTQRPIIEGAKGKLTDCLQQQGNDYFQKRNYSDALRCYTEALSYSPNKKTLLNNTGLAYQNINNFSEAEKCFKQVLKNQPKDMKALSNLAALQHAKGNIKAAQDLFQKVTKQSPEAYEAHVNNGKRLMSLHNYEEAIKEYKIAEKIRKRDDYFLFNDMAVALQILQQYDEALYYAEWANRLAQEQSPLFLLNRASILMRLNRVNEAKRDLNRASQIVRNPDRSNLVKFGINAENFKYIFNQLDHYAYLMSPIQIFREELAKEVVKCSKLEPPVSLKEVEEKTEKVQLYAINKVIAERSKEKIIQTQIDPEMARLDYAKVQKMIDEVKQDFESKILHLQKENHDLKNKLDMVKKQSDELQQKFLRYLPKSAYLSEKLQYLYHNDRIIWQYGKQLYWILNGYLKGYMLVQCGVVGKGDNIDRSTFNSAIKKVGGILEYAQNIPVIGQFSELISKVCGLLVDMEDDVIIKKVYETISFNYSTQAQLNDAICMVVMLFLEDPIKIEKVRCNIIFKPEPEGFFQRFKARLEEVGQWFEEKKNQFVMHMRGYQKVENIVQSQLAVIDVGLIISILLNITSNSQVKSPVLTNAAKRALADCRMEDMVVSAYHRENESLRVSNNSFCVVMKVQQVYDNPLLQSRGFAAYLRETNKWELYRQRILEIRDRQCYERISELLWLQDYEQILSML